MTLNKYISDPALFLCQSDDLWIVSNDAGENDQHKLFYTNLWVNETRVLLEEWTK